MRTRIKVIEKNNGQKKYQPQVKDDLTIFDVILFIPFFILSGGKSIWAYHGINTFSSKDLLMLYPLNCHPGESSEKEGEINLIKQSRLDCIEFDTIEEAKIYLDKYIQQRRNENLTEKKEIENKIAKEVKKEYYIEKTKIKEI